MKISAQTLLIFRCFKAHRMDLGKPIEFSLREYSTFWREHEVGATYELRNVNGSTEQCRVAYYPLPYYRDLRALIEIDRGTYTDFREVPIKFLRKL